VRRWLVHILRKRELAAVERVAGGDALALLGNPRLNADIWYLPNAPVLGFIEIPARPFLMGEGKKEHSVDLGVYYIACYPVTVAQFWAYLEESGYQAQGPWERYSSLDNHSVVAVTWYDARAHCEWCTEQLLVWGAIPEPLASPLRGEGWQVPLPSEAEWEKAARGTDARGYPRGNEADVERANYDDTGIGTTSALGCFPGGVSPYGVEDLSGNVWEWCHSLYRDYPYDPKDGREALEAEGDRVLRGGTFYRNEWLIRCASRLGLGPDYWDDSVGFRVVVAPGF